MKLQAGNKDDDYDLGEDEDQPESEDNDMEQKRESVTCVFPVIRKSRINLLVPNISLHILPYCPLYISQGSDKQNLFNTKSLF